MMLDSAAPTLLVTAIGAGIFIRLVAKEKHRREKHLQFRLEEKIRKIEEERELATKAAEKAAAEQAEKAKQEEVGKGTIARPLTAGPVEEPA